MICSDAIGAEENTMLGTDVGRWGLDAGTGRAGAVGTGVGVGVDLGTEVSWGMV